MARMTEEKLKNIVEQEFEDAMGVPGGQISEERAKAWDYYMRKPLGNEEEGQSQVVTSDVADIVDGIMPSLLRMFTVSENLIDFDAVGPEDVELAEQESDYVNHVFFKKNPSFWLFFCWFFDALTQKNGIVKAWWDESEEISHETYENLTEAELADLLDDDELEPVEQEEREEEITQTVQTPMGEVEVSETQALYNVKCRRTTKTGRARIEPVPVEEYRISSDSRSLDPSDARMVGHERPLTRSELVAMGFDRATVDKLPMHSDDRDSPEAIARRDKTDDDDDVPLDKSQQFVLVQEAWIRTDYDDDGYSELRHVIVAGKKLLLNEEDDRQPFHVISPSPLPHKHFGMASAEKVMDVQEVGSTLLRQVLDNLYLTNHPQHAVWEQAIGENTLDDLLTSRPGGINRFRRPVDQSYREMTVPFTAGSTFPMLEYWDKVKRDRTGVSSDGEGISPDALKNIQQSVMMQAMDVARSKMEMVARVFAETGIKTLFLHLHEMLLKHQKKQEVVRLRGKWVQVDPTSWRTRNDLTVRVGLGIGSREQNLLHLEAVWGKQREMIEAGGMGLTVSPKNIYNTASEIVKNANLKTPELFFTDPGDKMPQQDDTQGQMAKAQLQLAQEQIQTERDRNILREREQDMKHEREMIKLQQGQEKLEGDLMAKMEEIANKLTEYELKYQQDVPGARV